MRLKKYQKNHYNYFICIVFHCIKMKKGLVFNNKHNNYIIDKCYFQKDKNPVNINEADTEKNIDI